MLDATEGFQAACRRDPGLLGSEPLPEDAVHHQGDEADHRVGTDALEQTMDHRGNVELAFEHSEAAFDIGERRIPADDFIRFQVLDVGYEYQLAVEAFGPRF